MLWELLLTVHALCVERKPLLSLLCIDSLSGSEESGSGQRMTPELLNKVIQRKPRNENTIKNLMTPYFRHKSEESSS